MSKALIETLRNCEEYFDQRADAEYLTDSPNPVGNEAMRLLADVQEAIKMIEKEPSALIPIRLLKSLLRGGGFPGKHADDVRELMGLKREWGKK